MEMGHRRARHGAVGLAPVRRGVLLLAAFAVSGCHTIGSLTGLATGAVAGGATANPAIGYAVAVSTAAAVDATVAYISRVRARAEQDAIAGVAGPLAPGMAAQWAIRHDIPVGNEHGEVRVVREIVSSLAICREIAFSMLDDPPAPPAWFTTTICAKDATARGPDWKWASAEPAVERWGFLQ